MKTIFNFIIFIVLAVWALWTLVLFSSGSWGQGILSFVLAGVLIEVLRILEERKRRIYEANPEYKTDTEQQESDREKTKRRAAERAGWIAAERAEKLNADLCVLRRHADNRDSRGNALQRMLVAEKQEAEKFSRDMNYAELILHAAEKRGAENPVLVANEWMRDRAAQVNISPIRYEHINEDGSRVWKELKPNIPLIINGRDARKEEDLVVYSAMCIPTGKCYVGQTTRGLEARQAQHYEIAYKGGKDCPLFYEALRQYPPCNWKWSIIGRAKSIDGLDSMEKRAIAKYSRHPRGYNWHPGGE